jgi:hypothetical protein
VAGDAGPARGRPRQRGQHPQRAGLAGAVGAEETHDLARFDGEVDAVDGSDDVVASAELLDQPT